MSDEAPEQASKTEDPSQKKLEDAHKKGDVIKSQEVTTWFMLVGSAMVLALMAPQVASGLLVQFKDLMANAGQLEVGGPNFDGFLWSLFSALGWLSLTPLAVLAVFAVAANLVQHRPLLSLEPITPKLEKISPIKGFQRLFSSEALVNFAKGIVKIAVVGAVLFFVLWPEQSRLDTMMTADPMAILLDVQDLSIRIFIATICVVTIVALADFVYQRQRWWNRQKMTHQEVKEEYKQMEGDPIVKGRLRQLRHERSRQRMMQSVPEATVVITNPTHFAVALKYDKDMNAPKCVAKGADAIALRIREIARDNDVPIVENPPLARALYASVEIDEVIPVEHFKAVAQVIGYVMRLKKTRWRRA